MYSSKAKAVRSRVPIGQCFSRESSRLDLRWQEAASQNTDWRSRGAARIDYREILTQTAHANNDRTSESTREDRLQARFAVRDAPLEAHERVAGHREAPDKALDRYAARHPEHNSSAHQHMDTYREQTDRRQEAAARRSRPLV